MNTSASKQYHIWQAGLWEHVEALAWWADASLLACEHWHPLLRCHMSNWLLVLPCIWALLGDVAHAHSPKIGQGQVKVHLLSKALVFFEMSGARWGHPIKIVAFSYRKKATRSLHVRIFYRKTFSTKYWMLNTRRTIRL